MEMNFKNMTTEELDKIQELLLTEVSRRQKEKRKNARNKIYELLNEIETICEDNNFQLFYPIEDGDYAIELRISEIYDD